jgi:hypothetical protein
VEFRGLPGLLEIRDSLGAQISNIETKTPAEFDENFRQYGSQGYDLVFGHGFEFQDAARRVAPEFPHTIFVTTSGSTAGPNLAGLTFGFDDASYLAGVLPRSLARTNVIGLIGGAELHHVVARFRVRARGAREANPKIRSVVLHRQLGRRRRGQGAGDRAVFPRRGRDLQNADAAAGRLPGRARAAPVFVIGSNSTRTRWPRITLEAW